MSTRVWSRDNVVFDTGTIKLADFGLSKSLPVNKHAGYDLDSKFKLTGETGSYRYMAPEVFRHEPYNFKARRPCRPFPWPQICPCGVTMAAQGCLHFHGHIQLLRPESATCK